MLTLWENASSEIFSAAGSLLNVAQNREEWRLHDICYIIHRRARKRAIRFNLPINFWINTGNLVRFCGGWLAGDVSSV